MQPAHMQPAELFDPYKPALAAPKLTSADAADVRHRDIGLFVLLNIVTCGLYTFYILYEWSREVNGLVDRAKYPPLVTLLVNLATCGVGGLVYEILFAEEIAAATAARGIADRHPQLQAWVIGLNVAAFAISMIPFGVFIDIPPG